MAFWNRNNGKEIDSEKIDREISDIEKTVNNQEKRAGEKTKDIIDSLEKLSNKDLTLKQKNKLRKISPNLPDILKECKKSNNEIEDKLKEVKEYNRNRGSNSLLFMGGAIEYDLKRMKIEKIYREKAGDKLPNDFGEKSAESRLDEYIQDSLDRVKKDIGTYYQNDFQEGIKYLEALKDYLPKGQKEKFDNLIAKIKETVEKYEQRGNVLQSNTVNNEQTEQQPEQPTEQPEQPTGQQPEQPTEQPAEQLAEQPVEQPTEQQAEQPDKNDNLEQEQQLEMDEVIDVIATDENRGLTSDGNDGWTAYKPEGMPLDSTGAKFEKKDDKNYRITGNPSLEEIKAFCDSLPSKSQINLGEGLSPETQAMMIAALGENRIKNYDALKEVVENEEFKKKVNGYKDKIAKINNSNANEQQNQGTSQPSPNPSENSGEEPHILTEENMLKMMKSHQAALENKTGESSSEFINQQEAGVNVLKNYIGGKVIVKPEDMELMNRFIERYAGDNSDTKELYDKAKEKWNKDFASDKAMTGDEQYTTNDSRLKELKMINKRAEQKQPHNNGNEIPAEQPQSKPSSDNTKSIGNNNEQKTENVQSTPQRVEKPKERVEKPKEKPKGRIATFWEAHKLHKQEVQKTEGLNNLLTQYGVDSRGDFASSKMKGNFAGYIDELKQYTDKPKKEWPDKYKSIIKKFKKTLALYDNNAEAMKEQLEKYNAGDSSAMPRKTGKIYSEIYNSEEQRNLRRDWKNYKEQVKADKKTEKAHQKDVKARAKAIKKIRDRNANRNAKIEKLNAKADKIANKGKNTYRTATKLLRLTGRLGKLQHGTKTNVAPKTRSEKLNAAFEIMNKRRQAQAQK